MRLLFLGTSAATSFPLAFCKCNVCQYARQNKGKDIRKRSSLLINEDMLIDLGPDVVTASAMYNIDLTKIRTILQTHGHADHFDAGHWLTRLDEYAAQNVEKVQYIASETTFKILDQWMKKQDPKADLFDTQWLEKLTMEKIIIDSGDQIVLGDYRVTAVESLHDDRENALIFLIQYNGKSVLYGTDVLRFSECAWAILKAHHIDVVILDHTYGEGFNAGGHLDGGQVVDIIDKMKKYNIINDKSIVYATHISHEGNTHHDDMEAFAATKGYHIAYDGLEIFI